MCCPALSYGKSCAPCKHVEGEVACRGRGDCSGDGKRTGNGKCKCRDGFAGDSCEGCEAGRFLRNEDNDATCEKCDVACSACIGEGPSACTACATGYTDEQGSCVDVNECESSPCSGRTFCDNTPGSFSCTTCSDACADTCSGPDPRDCSTCAAGYEALAEGGCADVDECASGAASCGADTYCRNTPGKYDCAPCDASCQPGEGMVAWVQSRICPIVSYFVISVRLQIWRITRLQRVC